MSCATARRHTSRPAAVAVPVPADPAAPKQPNTAPKRPDAAPKRPDAAPGQWMRQLPRELQQLYMRVCAQVLASPTMDARSPSLAGSITPDGRMCFYGQWFANALYNWTRHHSELQLELVVGSLGIGPAWERPYFLFGGYNANVADNFVVRFTDGSVSRLDYYAWLEDADGKVWDVLHPWLSYDAAMHQRHLPGIDGGDFTVVEGASKLELVLRGLHYKRVEPLEGARLLQMWADEVLFGETPGIALRPIAKTPLAL